jgi:hypothetical protein
MSLDLSLVRTPSLPSRNSPASAVSLPFIVTVLLVVHAKGFVAA